MQKKIVDPTTSIRGYRQIFKIVCIQLAQQNRRARINVNATHVKKTVFENPNNTAVDLNLVPGKFTRVLYTDTYEIYY